MKGTRALIDRWRPYSPSDPGAQVLFRAVAATWYWSVSLRVAAVAFAGWELIATPTPWVRSHSLASVALLALSGIAAVAALVLNRPWRWPFKTSADPACVLTVALLAPVMPLTALALGLGALPVVVANSQRIRISRVGTSLGIGAMTTGYGLHRIATWTGPSSEGWQAFAPLIITFSLGTTLALFIWWCWTNCIEVAAFAQTADSDRRERLSRTFDRLVHDGLVALLETAASGQPLDEHSRREATEFALRARRELLGDPNPRSTSRMIDEAVSQAAMNSVVLTRIGYIEADPPTWVLGPFADALGALIANLKHAKVHQARLAVDASESSLDVTLVDDGIGRHETDEWGRSVQVRVLDQLASIGARAEVRSAPGLGTTWSLHWRAA